LINRNGVLAASTFYCLSLKMTSPLRGSVSLSASVE
jgi:hypothetical protein